MSNYNLPIILGLATTVLVSAPFPAQAQAKVYREISGKEYVRFSPEGLGILESAGLSIGSVENTTQPIPGFPYAFDLIPPPETDFTFSYDPETNVYIPFGNIERFAGSVTFNVDTNRLNLPSQLTFETLDIAFDPSPSGPNFYVASTIQGTNESLRLFDVEALGAPTFNLENGNFNLEVDLFATQELSDFLVAAGASQPIVGQRIGDARGERGFIEARSTKIPEPGSALAILTAASAALAMEKLRRRSA